MSFASIDAFKVQHRQLDRDVQNLITKKLADSILTMPVTEENLAELERQSAALKKWVNKQEDRAVDKAAANGVARDTIEETRDAIIKVKHNLIKLKMKFIGEFDAATEQLIKNEECRLARLLELHKELEAGIN